MNKHHGFTLIELLVTVTIVITLSVLTITITNKIRHKASMAVEIVNARQLILAYHSYSTDHNGKLLEGYRADPTAENLAGEPLHFPVNARYPWRLMPYLNNTKIILFNGNEKALTAVNSDYEVSVMPNFGLNAVLVGGNYGSGSPLPPSNKLTGVYGKYFVSHLSEVTNPESLIVFASARGNTGNVGYFEVRPPNLTNQVWSNKEYSPDSEGSAYGFVDLRWSKKAVAVMMGGNVELLNENQLRDMRRWSNQASAENDKNYMIKKIQNN